MEPPLGKGEISPDKGSNAPLFKGGWGDRTWNQQRPTDGAL